MPVHTVNLPGNGLQPLQPIACDTEAVAKQKGAAAPSKMARPEGFEPPTTKFVAWYSIQLSYGRALTLLSLLHATHPFRRLAAACPPRREAELFGSAGSSSIGSAKFFLPPLYRPLHPKYYLSKLINIEASSRGRDSLTSLRDQQSAAQERASPFCGSSTRVSRAVARTAARTPRRHNDDAHIHRTPRRNINATATQRCFTPLHRARRGQQA